MVAKRKRSKPIARQLVRNELEQLNLFDLGSTLGDLETIVRNLIDQYGTGSQFEVDGPEYESVDHIKIYTLGEETEAQFQARRKKILNLRRAGRKSAKTRAAASAKLEAEIRARSAPPSRSAPFVGDIHSLSSLSADEVNEAFPLGAFNSKAR